MNKKNAAKNKRDQRLVKRSMKLHRLLPPQLWSKPQTYGAGSTVVTFEGGWASSGNENHEYLYPILTMGEQKAGIYFLQYKYFKIISVIIAAAPSPVGGELKANLVWAGSMYPDLSHDDTTRRVPISTNRVTYAIFTPPKIVVNHAALANNFVTDLGRMTATQDHVVNMVPVIPGVLSFLAPANVKVDIYIKIEFRGQTGQYVQQP